MPRAPPERMVSFCHYWIALYASDAGLPTCHGRDLAREVEGLEHMLVCWLWKDHFEKCCKRWCMMLCSIGRGPQGRRN